MNPSRTIYNNFLTKGEFDSGRFIESILLFDLSLISSAAALRRLIQVVGVEGTLQLLESGLIAVVGGGFTAQGTYDYKVPGFFANRPLDRPLRYGFEAIFVDHTKPPNRSPEAILKRELDKAQDVHEDNILRIQDAVLTSMRIIDGRTLKIGDDFRADLKSKKSLIIDLLVDLMPTGIRQAIGDRDWRIDVVEVSDDVYQIETNLPSLLKISNEDLHEILKSPFFKITGINLQLGRMRSINAAAGLTEEQTHIIERRVDFLSKVHVKSDPRGKFAEILEIADIPSLDIGKPFDAKALIALRETNEACSFRDWLQNSQKIDESDLKDLIKSWRRRLGEFFRTDRMRGLRFLTSNGIGAIFGGLVGVAAGGIDFFLDRFLPRPGPIGFIIGDYQRFLKKQGSMQWK